MEFWKISHGPKWFSQTDYDYFFDNKLIVVGGADQVKNIRSMSSGDYFYLTYGNTNRQGVQLLGRIIDGSSSPCTYAFPRYKYWEQRKYELVKLTVPYDKFYREDYKKKWTPNFISTIARVPEDEQTDFEKYILKPFFGVSIADLPYLPSNPLPSETAEVNLLSKKIGLNTILYGVPGTGKTYMTTAYAVAICNNQPLSATPDKNEYAKLRADGRICFTTFHQSYGYEEFIEGIKPTVTNGNISYEVKAGVFKNFCETAENRPTENFVFIIDEINRGNISKIFGELITLIEDDKRGEISATLPYSQEEFTVPPNVYIIGTMNTADRSIALMDTALRRRFNFIEMIPRPELLSDNVGGVNIRAMLEKINTRIETLYDREHTIGHAYFIECKTLDDVEKIFRDKIIPLLQEYFFENWEQIYLVLGGKFIEKTPLPVLGESDEKYRYTINVAAFKDVASYAL